MDNALNPVAEEEEVEKVVIEDDEDVEQIKVASDPKLPSQQEVDEHRCTHVPYRDWCKWCVMGRGEDCNILVLLLHGSQSWESTTSSSRAAA